MPKSMPITGSVLSWALTDRDLTTAKVADRLSVEEELVNSWIEEDSQPNKGQFDALVKLLACNESFLFLPEPPESSRHHRVEFRRHAGAPEEIPTETTNAMRTAQTVLRITEWLATKATEDGISWPSVPRATRRENPDTVALRLREWLNWSTSKQTAVGATDSSAAKAFRSSLQKNHIVVLHLTMDEGVTRGFSLHEGEASVVAVNTRDHVRARFFSYAHELVHLALRDDSVCLTRNDSSDVERFCNRTAASMLMPETSFREFVDRRFGGHVNTVDNVKSLRNYFKVSIQAAAIRALTLGLTPHYVYDQVLQDVETRGGGGGYVPGNERTRPRVRVDQYGSGFVNTLMSAEDAGHLRRHQILDLLHLSDRELNSARDLASSEVG